MRPVVRAVRETGITHAELKVLAQEYRLAHPRNYEKIMQEYHVPRAYWIFAGKRLKEIKRIERKDALWRTSLYEDFLKRLKKNRREHKHRRLKRSESAVQAVSKEEKKSVLPTASEEEHWRRLQRIRDTEVL
jgi:hypothetical protein